MASTPRWRRKIRFLQIYLRRGNSLLLVLDHEVLCMVVWILSHLGGCVSWLDGGGVLLRPCQQRSLWSLSWSALLLILFRATTVWSSDGGHRLTNVFWHSPTNSWVRIQGYAGSGSITKFRSCRRTWLTSAREHVQEDDDAFSTFLFSFGLSCWTLLISCPVLWV